METRSFKFMLLSLLYSICLASCAEKEQEALATPSKYLYISSGLCYSGNNTTFTAATASNVIYRLNAQSGQLDLRVADYFRLPSQLADTPIGMTFGSDNEFLVLVDNTSAAIRRIDNIQLASFGNRSSLVYSATAFATNLRSLQVTSGGNFVVARTNSIELISSLGVRIGAPYIAPNTVSCGSTNSSIRRAKMLPNGMFVFVNAANTHNRIGVLPSSGGNTCLSLQAAPDANAFPTDFFFDEKNSLLVVAFASNAVTAERNSIYAYSLDTATGVISNPQKLYDRANYPATHNFHLYGISAMAHDSETNELYISSAINDTTTVVNYRIEKFRYDPTKIGSQNSEVLTRLSEQPFYSYGTDTRCISDLIIR